MKQATGGGAWQYLSARIKSLEIDTSHFGGTLDKRGKVHRGGDKKQEWQEILIHSKNIYRERSSKLRRAYAEYCGTFGIKIECTSCKNDGLWMGKQLLLEIDHIDKCRTNNLPTNLMWLCPNCHTVKTYNGK